ncbi:phage portal protein [Vibrio fortis]|uniref:phage portal protein n=1 Tax=Vibrio fortis TaxID=212667 RepID=UPI0038CD8580
MILDHTGNPFQAEKSFSNFNYDFNFMHSSLDVAGIKVSPLAAYQHGIVYSCIRVLAESVGQLPVRMFTLTDEGRQPVRNHKMLRVLTKMPNDYMTWQEFLEMIVTHLNLDGNFYAYVNKNRLGKIVEIIPIPAPSSVSLQMNKGQIVYRVADDSIIKLPKQVFTSKEMLHIKSSSIDGLKGITPIQVAANAIGLSMAAEKHGEHFFKNNATPNAILTMDGSLDDDAYDRLKSNWMKNHGGLANAHKLGILEEGLKFQVLSVNHKDSQFLETRNFQKNEICSAFRVPPQLVYADANVTYSNVEQAMMSFHRDTLIPLITRIISRINCMLPDDIEIDFDDRHLLRGDSKTQAEVAKTYFDIGSYTINEVRQLRGDAPVEGGDVVAVQTNNYTLGDLVELVKQQTELHEQAMKPAPAPVAPTVATDAANTPKTPEQED